VSPTTDTKKCDRCSGTTTFSRSCGADVCNRCGAHRGLARCYCGWSGSGADGRRELIEMGEVIDDDY